MRSYIKIYGPPVLEAIKVLEKIAIDMPEVCIMDYAIAYDVSKSIAEELDVSKVSPKGGSVTGFFLERTGVVLPIERRHSIISKHGQKLGEYDFFFEWFEKPEISQLNELIRKIDDALKPLGCLYKITTK
jgi:hypothetical protein